MSFRGDEDDMPRPVPTIHDVFRAADRVTKQKLWEQVRFHEKRRAAELQHMISVTLKACPLENRAGIVTRDKALMMRRI